MPEGGFEKPPPPSLNRVKVVIRAIKVYASQKRSAWGSVLVGEFYLGIYSNQGLCQVGICALIECSVFGKKLILRLFCHLVLELLTYDFSGFILLHEKFLPFDWLRAMVFQLNLKYLHVKITNLLRVVV